MTTNNRVPATRLRKINDAKTRSDGAYVLYWMVASRRLEWNFALQHAVDRARALELPLLVFEPLRVDYPWAADRFHRFVVDGMAEHHRRLDGSPIGYYPWIEPQPGTGKGMLAELAADAAAVVTDDTPMFFYPDMLAAAGAQLGVSLEAVDSAGLLPVRSSERAFPTAHGFRRFLQRELPAHLEQMPRENPIGDLELAPCELDLGRLAPGRGPTSLEKLEAPDTLAALPIDHSVQPTGLVGGTEAARIRLQRFVDELLPDYADERNHPDHEHASRLSPYLHFGHISSHEIFATLAAEELWSPASLSEDTRGARTGWWGMSPGSEAFLDQLVTWRELGLNMCHHRDDYDRYESLPEWALTTLDEHRDDERPYLYELEKLEAATTHDEVWNAAQAQLVVDGRIHNYLRMLWGKKILEWSVSPEQALTTMIALNNKYALDGRDPNSYSGIFWVLGRYDRAWGPERPVFGKVRYMSSDSAARKLRLRDYLRRYQPVAQPLPEVETC